MHNKKLGIIGAMDSEIALLCSRLEQTVTETHGGLDFHLGKLAGTEVVIVKCGIGKVYAARCAQMLIDLYQPEVLVNTGIAGGVCQGLAVGDVVIGSALVQYDFDVTAFGYAKGNLCDRSCAQHPTLFHSHPATIGLIRKAAASLLPDSRIKEGTIATGDVFVSSREMKQSLWEEFHAMAAEMEGCAIAQVAAANGTPFVVLRAISDLADGTASESFDTFEQETADLSAAILERLAGLL